MYTFCFPVTIKALVKDEVEKLSPRKVEVKTPKGVKITEGTQHHQFETLLKFISAKQNVYMVGPTGSGKTRTCREVAKALDMKFYSMSVGPMTTQSQIMGYPDATGNYVRTNFREAYENGGVFLFDEIDSANSNVLTCVNQATSADICGFPVTIGGGNDLPRAYDDLERSCGRDAEDESLGVALQANPQGQRHEPRWDARLHAVFSRPR